MGDEKTDNQTQSGDENVRALTEHIAQQLGERYPYPVQCIGRVIEVCGEEMASDLLQETLKIEAEGGLMLPNKKRRRTPGGVFFFLVRQRTSEEQQTLIFRPDEHLYWPPGGAKALPEGTARQVEIIIKGRPEKLEEGEELVIVQMTLEMGRLPNLPQGMPKPVQEPMRYKIYIASKHWNKVEQYLHIPEDELIVTGLLGRDPNGGGLAVFAMMVTTRQREWLQRQQTDDITEPQPRRKPGKSEGGRSKGRGKPEARQGPEQDSVDPVSGLKMQPEDARKLAELRAAADIHRQKIAQLEASGSTTGLTMIRKLLQSAEGQIRAIEKKYADDGQA